MTTTATRLSDLPALNAEIAACRKVQSWAPGSTRSDWIDELEAIRDATTDDELADAIVDADARQIRQATKVARGLADADAIRAHLSRDTTAEQDAVIAGLDLAHLVDWMRANSITIDQATQGERDGWVITATEAVAYAGMRDWRDGADPRWVNVDLLTGEVTAW